MNEVAVNQSLRGEINHIIKINISGHMSEEMAKPFSYLVTEKIIDVIEKRIDSRIQYAKQELKKGQHDFEGKQNLRYEIERLLDFKEEILK